MLLEKFSIGQMDLRLMLRRIVRLSGLFRSILCTGPVIGRGDWVVGRRDGTDDQGNGNDDIHRGGCGGDGEYLGAVFLLFLCGGGKGLCRVCREQYVLVADMLDQLTCLIAHMDMPPFFKWRWSFLRNVCNRWWTAFSFMPAALANSCTLSEYQ